MQARWISLRRRAPLESARHRLGMCLRGGPQPHNRGTTRCFAASRATLPCHVDCPAGRAATTIQRRFDPSKNETAAQRRGSQILTTITTQISASAIDTDLRQGPAPQPPSTRRPRRTGQPQRARGRFPPARSRFAAPITRSAEGELPNHTRRDGACQANAHPAPSHRARSPLRRDRAAGRIGQRRFGGLAAHAAMRWLEGAGTPRDVARAARRGRDAPSGLGPGAHCRRRLRKIAPPSAVGTRKEPRGRAAGARGIPNLQLGESAHRPKGALPKGAASRPASGLRRGADPARGFPETDRRRVLRARTSDRGPRAGCA